MNYLAMREELRDAILGPWYKIGMITGQIAAPSRRYKSLIYLSMIPSVVPLLLLIARAIYTIIRSNQAGVNLWIFLRGYFKNRDL